MATVCVTNLPNETSEADLRELFAEYGSIQRVRLLSAEPYRRLQSNGYFDLNSCDVERAVAGVDGHLFKGSIIRVSQVADEPLSRKLRWTILQAQRAVLMTTHPPYGSEIGMRSLR